MRHNKIRDFMLTQAKRIYSDIEKEPVLQPVDGTELAIGSKLDEDARSDIRIRGYHREFHNTFLDVQVTNLKTETNAKRKIRQVFNTREMEKNRHYKDRIAKIENGSFIPLVFSSQGALGPEAHTFVASIIAKLAEKLKEPK